jgi:hypothetical protein
MTKYSFRCGSYRDFAPGRGTHAYDAASCDGGGVVTLVESCWDERLSGLD